MRVIGGSAKGRRLRTTRGEEMRPTTDMARRTIFDILGDRVHDARVLDLFAGAGTLGIEALSRGARVATFVELDRRACEAIDANLRETQFDDRARVRRADVLRFIARAADTPFDLVFLDPPYDRGLGFITRVLGRLVEGSWIGLGGTVVVEAEGGHVAWPPGLREIRTRRFGRTQVSMAERRDDRERSDLPGDL